MNAGSCALGGKAQSLSAVLPQHQDAKRSRNEARSSWLRIGKTDKQLVGREDFTPIVVIEICGLSVLGQERQPKIECDRSQGIEGLPVLGCTHTFLGLIDKQGFLGCSARLEWNSASKENSLSVPFEQIGSFFQ